MFLLRIIAVIFFVLAFFVQNAYCAGDYKVKDVVIDSSDKMILIRGQGNYKNSSEAVYIPMPSQNGNSINFITKVNAFKILNPSRYVVDIPNATLINPSRTYKVQNSSIIKSIQMSQFSVNPNVVRVVFNSEADLTRFKTYTNGSDIIVQYAYKIINNSIQYKFYTPNGDMDKTSKPQNTSAVLTYNTAPETIDLTPKFQTKYHLSQISQNSDGLILRGLGSVSFQRATYSPDNTKAVLILDNASMLSRLEDKSYNIPSSQKNINATLTINKINDKKIKLTLLGEGLRDYRFIVSPDGQSLFVSHRSYIVNTIFSSDTAKVNSYKLTKNANVYSIFDVNFNQSVTYDVFEMGDNFYLDINNLGDYSEELFNKMLESADVKIEAIKISSDKTRFVIPTATLNFSYANVESNAKSIKLCFKEKPIKLEQPEIIIT